MRVGAARTDELGELRMTHRQDPEDKPSIEGIIQLLDLLVQLDLAAFQLVLQLGLSGRAERFHQVDGILDFFYLFFQDAVLIEAVRFVGHAVQPREGRAKDHARFILQGAGELHGLRQQGPGCGAFVVHHQGDARVAQGFDPGGDRKPGGNIQRFRTVR